MGIHVCAIVFWFMSICVKIYEHVIHWCPMFSFSWPQYFLRQTKWVFTLFLMKLKHQVYNLPHCWDIGLRTVREIVLSHVLHISTWKAEKRLWKIEVAHDSILVSLCIEFNGYLYLISGRVKCTGGRWFLWVLALTALAEDTGLILSIHTVAHNCLRVQFQGIYALFWPP